MRRSGRAYAEFRPSAGRGRATTSVWFNAGVPPGKVQPLRPKDPRRIGPYEVIGFLGSGGMGAVYVGRRDDGRLAAIKVVHSEYAPA